MWVGRIPWPIRDLKATLMSISCLYPQFGVVMELTGERIVPGSVNACLLNEHMQALPHREVLWPPGRCRHRRRLACELAVDQCLLAGLGQGDQGEAPETELAATAANAVGTWP